MTTGAITDYIDVAQIAIDGFWILFAGLLYYLHQEDKREGYPLESDRSRAIRVQGWPPIPSPKTFTLQDGTTVSAPSGRPATPVQNAVPVAAHLGAALQPTGDPMLAGVGPGSWNARADVPDVTWDNELRVVPLASAAGYGVSEHDTDPRGLPVVGADGESGGVVRDLWLDRSDVMFRYLEVETRGGRHVMVPLPFAKIGSRSITVRSVLGRHFEQVPGLAQPGRITRLEEEKIAAFYGAGTLYATPARQEPLF